MSLVGKLRRGEGPFWGTLKRLIKSAFCLHIPVFWLNRPIFAFCYALHVLSRNVLRQTLRFLWFEPLFRSQCFSIGEGFQMGLMLPFLNGKGRITIGNHVQFGGQPNFVFGTRGDTAPELIIGDHTFIGHHSSFGVAKSVTIGKHCLIAGGVYISDYDGHPLDAMKRRVEPASPESFRPVVIGDDVWIGTGALVLKGVHIGNRSIVGAGAVVARDVPPDVVVAGNPARVVKQLTEERMKDEG